MVKILKYWGCWRFATVSIEDGKTTKYCASECDSTPIAASEDFGLDIRNYR
jgi:hypothetical protein